MTGSFDPLVKRLLDGELRLADLPPEARQEAEAGLRLMQALDRAPVALPPELDQRVMARVRRRRSRLARAARWLSEPREIRFHIRPWMLGPVLAAALVLLFARGQQSDPAVNEIVATEQDSAFVRFVLYAPEARHVALAGTFNEWSTATTPLQRAAPGVWTTTIRLPIGQHQYSFVVDGRRWTPDPVAPHVDDGFGQINSILSVETGGRTL